MASAWSELEILVSKLEESLAPEGVKVTSPERFYFEDGLQKAEVDVTLRMNVGSVRMLIGLECRLRPSDGLQDAGWIEQVAGKGRIVGAHKMIAVSGTGFTEPAIRAASTLGIDLRVVEKIEAEEVKNWFATMSVVFQCLHWELLGELSVKTDPPTLTGASRLGDLTFIHTNEERVSFQELVWREVERIHEVNEAFIPPNTPLNWMINFGTIRIRSKDNREFKLLNFQVPIRTWREEIAPKLLLSLYRDPTTPNMIAISGIGEIHASDGAFKMLIIGSEDMKNPGSRRLQIKRMTLDNQPDLFKAGTRLTVFGSKQKSSGDDFFKKQ
jgi:hypothetical protein